jgi:hypothetical protein
MASNLKGNNVIATGEKHSLGPVAAVTNFVAGYVVVFSKSDLDPGRWVLSRVSARADVLPCYIRSSSSSSAFRNTFSHDGNISSAKTV